jgi:hypothetical protein
VYKERLLIYHFGVGRVNMMVFSRVSALVALGFITVIWVPAYYQYGTPLPYLGLGRNRWNLGTAHADMQHSLGCQLHSNFVHKLGNKICGNRSMA